MLHDGPAAIRYPRGTGPGVAVKEQPVALEIGKAEVVYTGDSGAMGRRTAATLPSSAWVRCCPRRCVSPA